MINFSNLTGELSLKAIAWDFDQGKFVSPSFQEFIWSEDGLVSASCNKGCKDEDIPGDDCLCGLYSTFRWSIINQGYTKRSEISPILLVEAIGKTWIYTEGVRSYMQGVHAVINQWNERAIETVFGPKYLCWGKVATKQLMSKAKASSEQASDFFKVPILEHDPATVAMDLWNIHINTFEDDYQPESPIVNAMSKEQILELTNQYLPKKEVKWEDLVVKE